MMDGDTKAVIKPGSIDDLFGETFQANRANWLIDDFKIVYQVQEQDVTVTVEYDAETDLADELHITVEGDNDFAESLRKKLKDTDFQLKGLPSPKEGTIMIDDWYGEYNSPFY